MGVPPALAASWGADSSAAASWGAEIPSPMQSHAASHTASLGAGTSTPGADERRVAVTLVDYVPEKLAELSFKRGDTIRDVVAAWPRGGEPGAREGEEWWRGKLRGREGIFRRSQV